MSSDRWVCNVIHGVYKFYFLPTLHQQYLFHHDGLNKTSNYIIVEQFMIKVHTTAPWAKMIFDEDIMHTATPEFRAPGDF